MMNKVKHFVAYNFLAILVAIQVVMLINYWYFLLKNISQASIRDTLAYQGKIIDNDSVAIDDGLYNMRFRVFNDATAGTELWAESWTGANQGVDGSQVQVTSGVFSVELNSLCGNWSTGGCALNPGGVDFDTSSLYLQVELDVDGNGVMDEVFLPRKRFTSIAYSMNTAKLNGKEVGTSGNTVPLLDGTNIWSGLNTFVASTSATAGIVIKGAASQSANLQEWQDTLGTVLTSVTAEGNFTLANSSSALKTGSYTFNMLSGSPIASAVASPPSTADANIASYWKFDEGTGATSIDEVGGRTLTVSNATWDTAGAFEYTGDNGILFNSAFSQYISLAHDAGLSPADITVYAWIKTTDSGNYRGIVDKGWANGGYVLQLRNGYASFDVQDASGNFYMATGTTYLANDTWHMIAGTYDSSTQDLKIYVDGQLESTTPSVLMAANSLSVVFGGDSASTLSYNGLVDNIIIYNDSRTAGEILADYNASLTIESGNGVAFSADTVNAYGANDKLYSWKAAGTEKAYLNGNGELYVSSVIDSANNKEIVFNTTPSAVNYLTVTNAATGAAPVFSADGETDVSLYIKPKGTGSVIIPSASGAEMLSVSSVGYLTMSTVDPEIRLIDTGNNEYARITRSDTSNKLILYNRVVVPGGGTPIGYQLDFDNTERYITYPNNALLRPANLTLEIWAKITDASANKRGDIFIQDDTYTYNTGYQLFTYLGALYWRVGNGSTYSTISTSVTDNTWYHIVATYDGSNLHMYLNGSEIGSGTALAGPIAYNATSPLTGAYIGVSAYNLYGSIDELKIYDTALGLADAQESYNSGSGLYGSAEANLVAGYHFDAGTGTTVADYSGNGLNGTFTGTPIWTAAEKAINPTGPGGVSEIAILQSEDGVADGENGILTIGAEAGTINLLGGAINFGTGALLSVSDEGILTSGVPDGTAPFIITSTTKVDNLNADLLDGHDSAYFEGLGGGTPDGNSWALVYDNTVTGSAVSDLTVTGLDGDADEIYKISIKLVGGATGSPEIYIQPNADSTSANYRFSYVSNGDAIGTQTTGPGLYTTYCDNENGLGYFEGTMFAKSGTYRGYMGTAHMRADGTTNAPGINQLGGVWKNTADNITSIKFNSSVASGIGVGSHFMIWKKN